MMHFGNDKVKQQVLRVPCYCFFPNYHSGYVISSSEKNPQSNQRSGDTGILPATQVVEFWVESTLCFVTHNQNFKFPCGPTFLHSCWIEANSAGQVTMTAAYNYASVPTTAPWLSGSFNYSALESMAAATFCLLLPSPVL